MKGIVINRLHLTTTTVSVIFCSLNVKAQNDGFKEANLPQEYYLIIYSDNDTANLQQGGLTSASPKPFLNERICAWGKRD